MNTVPGVNTRFYVLPLVRSETGVLPLPLIFFFLTARTAARDSWGGGGMDGTLLRTLSDMIDIAVGDLETLTCCLVHQEQHTRE